MKMNKPYIEIVRFDAEDVIATSGVINCAVSPLKSGDRLLHYNHNNKSYFVYDVTNNSNEYVGPNYSTTLHHNEQNKEYKKGDIEYKESSTTGAGYSAYIYDAAKGDWTWWDDNGSHGNY